MSARIEALRTYKNDVKVWVDEAIWGHRFYNDQTPWLVLLEFLAIFESRKPTALKEDLNGSTQENFEYTIPRHIHLRQLIFNNPYCRHTESSTSSSNDRWSEWQKYFSSDINFNYLKDRFRDFNQMAHVIYMLQTTGIEPHRQRRWTSRFLFPYGPNCIYADLPLFKPEEKAPDRRFFARGGELLYLMLSRSGEGPELANQISDKLLRKGEMWDGIVSALLPSSPQQVTPNVSNKIGYLPFAERPEYNALAESWKRLLRLDLPGNALLDPIMRISTLHMLIYMLRRANEEIGTHREPFFVLEIASPRRTPILALSEENLRANRMLSTHAVRAYVESCRRECGWEKVIQSPTPAQAALEFLKSQFEWKENDIQDCVGPDGVLDKLLNYAEQRHNQHVAKVHMEWARQIGLISTRTGVGTWYSANDSLLKSLVLCIVNEKRKEYRLFLAELYARFRIVLGPTEAKEAYNELPIDQHAFITNTQRLEQRLRTLGLLRRLSDDCAYVENPFWKQHDSE